MEWLQQGQRCFVAGILVWAGLACAQDSPPPPVRDVPLLTLDTSILQLPNGVPDMRLKLQRPTWSSVSTLDPDWQVQGLEFRLPMRGVWVGVEEPPEGEERRATFSIRRGF